MNVDILKLREAVQKVRHTLSKDKAVEAFRWICFRDKKITTFDGHTATITASPVPELECVLPGAKFATLLDVLKDSENARFDVSKGWLKVKAGRYETKLPLFDIRDYPVFEIKGSEIFCKATNLVPVMKAVKPSIEKDENKQAIYGIGFRGHYVYTTDGKRITRAELDKPVESSVSISKTGGDQLIRLGQPDHLFRIGSMIGGLYKEQKTLVMTRMLEAMFPYDAVDSMFEEGRSKLTLATPPDLLPAVERVRALSDDEESSLMLNCEDGMLTISTESDTGTSKDVITFHSKKGFEIKVHADRLRAVLRSLKPVTIDLTDVVYGDARMLLFEGEHYQHALALMS